MEHQMFAVSVTDSTAEEMVACGQYDQIVDGVTPGNTESRHGSGDRMAVLVPIGEIKPPTLTRDSTKHTADQVEYRLDEMGLRSADGCELLAFGARYPEEQLEKFIIALGSKDEGDHVLCLGYTNPGCCSLRDTGTERMLYRTNSRFGWSRYGLPRQSFLAFPKDNLA